MHPAEFIAYALGYLFGLARVEPAAVTAYVVLGVLMGVTATLLARRVSTKRNV